MDDSITLSPEKECVSVGVKEEKESESVNLNLLDSCLKEEIKSSPVAGDDICQHRVSVSDLSNKVAVECENQNENVKEDCKKEAVDENGEGALVVEKGKRGRKRKNLKNSECSGEVKVKVNGRVLRSRTMMGTGSVKVDYSRLNESVVGFKRQMEAECLDQTDLQKEVDKSSPLKGGPQKKQKQKRRGRPPKNQGEAVFKKKKTSECLDQTELQNEVNESSQLTGGLDKKRKRVGRPPKGKGKEVVLQEIQKRKHKDLKVENLKRRGRPPKVQAGNVSTNAKNLNVKVVKKKKNLLKAKDVKTGPKIQNVQNEDRASEITDDKKQKVKITEERNDHTIAEETVNGDNNTKQSKHRIGGLERREEQQLVRDKIVSIIMKAGWTIEYRPRQNRQYLDAVYVDGNGKTHWSCTKAYFSLKRKIENEKASSKEVSAFTPIPDEEMSILFRLVSKVRSDKNIKKKKRGKNVSKAEIVFSGEAPPKKKPGKKKKDSKKRKEINSSAVKSGNKLPGVKVRRPKVTQKGGQIRKPRLVARGSSKGPDKENDEDSTLYSGKRNLLSWMIDSGVIMPDDKLQYGEGRRRNGLCEGTVTCDGVRCSCCDETMDLLKFVSHVGGKATQGLENIYLQSGSSLLKCLLESWRKEEESSKIRFNFVDVKGDDPSDDTCNICGDGGDLICCDGCPSTFHQSCLDIQNFPSGVWHCIYCSCKLCGLVVYSASQNDDSSHAPNPEMLTCCLCEEKFHYSCLQEDAVKVVSTSLSFCGKKCQEIHEQLQTYLGVKFELEEGYSWTLLNRSDVSQIFAILDDQQKIECNSKLAVAFSVMDECFKPIIDERSGVNKIHNVVYNCGSNFRRLNYSGFFTAILEKGDELISAASIRIHGNRLAEMPFIGTRNMYRRQGMCRQLLDAIENALSSFGVEELVIPAISELYNTWTKVFGFKPLEESTRQALKGMGIIVFPGTDMLQKRLLKNQFTDNNLSLTVAEKTVECITVVNDDNTLQSEVKSASAVDYEQRSGEDATHLESETPTTSFQVPNDSDVRSSNNDVTLVNTSPLTSKVIPKNRFDLNLVATDTDIQSIDDETLSRDTQVCKNSFDLSDSKPLVLV